MTTHDDLHARLAVLADSRVPDDTTTTPPPADVLWRAGDRRRWRSRAGVAVAVAAVALLVVAAFVPFGGVPEAVPANSAGQPLPSYPQHVAMPWSVPRSTTPGPSAIAVAGTSADDAGVWLIGPTGAVSFLPLHALTVPAGGLGSAEEDRLALSPDGLWLATGSGLHDLVTGRAVGAAPERGWSVPDALWNSAPWWSPDSRRVLYPAGPGVTSSEGLVVDVSGTTAVVPAAGVGDALILAGWRDSSTVVGLWRKGVEEFLVMTWTIGDERWTNGPSISWPGWEAGWPEVRPQAPGTVSEPMTAAAVSPDGSRIVLLGSAQDGSSGTTVTRAQVFDSRTGGLVGFPVGDVPAAQAGWSPGSSIGWAGWGCRMAWRHGVPVITDDGAVRLAGDPGADDLVSLPATLAGCPAFAGDALQGTPVENAGALWAARLRTWAIPLALLLVTGFLVWRFGRRTNWREPLPRLPFIYPTAGTGGR